MAASHALATDFYRSAAVASHSDERPPIVRLQERLTIVPDSVPYGTPTRTRWVMLAVSIALHAALFCALFLMSTRPNNRLLHSSMTLSLIPVTPPAAPPPPRQVPEPKLPVEKPQPPRIEVPPPIVTAPAAPTIAPAPPVAPPPQPVVVARPPAPAPQRTVAVDDLGAKLISANPPRYPVESRRKREQGIVVLRVMVGENGRVESISIDQSSGFERLDKAALNAVRDWRWSPTLMEGVAVRVRGLVRMPFELKS